MTRIRTRTSDPADAFGPQLCYINPAARGGANINKRCYLCANTTCVTPDEPYYDLPGSPFRGRCCHTSPPRACTLYENPGRVDPGVRRRRRRHRLLGEQWVESRGGQSWVGGGVGGGAVNETEIEVGWLAR
jgi:hypothetical protein